MTLRTRLVLALVVLATVALGVFGVATTTLYGRSQRQQLDDQLRSSSRPLTGLLRRAYADPASVPDTCTTTSGSGSSGGSSGSTTASTTTGTTVPASGARPGSGFGPGPGTDVYAALVSAGGKVLSCVEPVSVTARPDLPSGLTFTREEILTTGSATGSGRWRVLVTPASLAGSQAQAAGSGPNGQVDDVAIPDGALFIAAVPTSGVDESVSRLIRIELVAALVLLSTLGAGSWLILRRGLRPLEQMAGSAATITTGDLSLRVEPADGRTEVGQLGLALNTMLEGIEGSFREREATELRLRRFLADASHELRTPLTSIQGFAELFRVGDPERIDLPVILRRIEQEAARMKTLVEDLLLLARLDQTRAFEPAPVDLTVLAADACTDAVAVEPDRSITLDAPEPVVVQGDADHLRQAIANLVTNALSHTPAGSPVEVATRVEGNRATVTVRDHGPGLGDDALAHVFDRFWQADPSRVGAGAGLGLSIVAGIAEEHGGRAAVANAADGGATFRLEVPVSRATPEA